MNIKSYFIKINGEQVAVTEEVYHAYKRPAWVERKRRNRETRCRDNDGNRCMKDCQLCDKQRNGGNLSLDKFAEDGYEIADLIDVTEVVAEKMLKEALHAAIEQLSDDERQIIDSAFQGKSERTAAMVLGLPRNTFVYRRDKIVDKLRRILSA